MATPDVPDEAVEAAEAASIRAMFACRCDVAWTGRRLHAPDCVQELGEEALDFVVAARADERAQVLAEVDAALRDGDRIGEWLGPEYNRPSHVESLLVAADYLRDLGADGDGEG